jgi:GCC2 and GCC3.
MKNLVFSGSKSIADCVPVCGYGTYSPTGLVPCLECPRNSYTGEPPTDGFKDCQACPANTFTYQPAAGGKEHCRGEILSWFLSFLHFKILREQRMQDGVLTLLLPRIQVFWDVMLDCWINSSEV